MGLIGVLLYTSQPIKDFIFILKNITKDIFVLVLGIDLKKGDSINKGG